MDLDASMRRKQENGRGRAVWLNVAAASRDEDDLPVGCSAVSQTLFTYFVAAFVAHAPLAAHAYGLEATETVRYVHTDPLGSVVAESDENGHVVTRFYYDPYGSAVDARPLDEPGFTGHITDSSTGMLYMQQRYYDPIVGRFLSVDPLDSVGAGQGFNRYHYAAGNPYRFVDPDGRCAKVTGSQICLRTLTSVAMRMLQPSADKVDMASTQRSWPVHGYYTLNKADKPGEGRGEFGTPRTTQRGRSTHTGIDVQAPAGARVGAFMEGVVLEAHPNPSASYGWQVIVDHGGGTFSQSAHMQRVDVSPGDWVRTGQGLGAVGRTGNTPRQGDTHLHFEIRIGGSNPRSAGGTVVDPLSYLPEPQH